MPGNSDHKNRFSKKEKNEIRSKNSQKMLDFFGKFRLFTLFHTISMFFSCSLSGGSFWDDNPGTIFIFKKFKNSFSLLTGNTDLKTMHLAAYLYTSKHLHPYCLRPVDLKTEHLAAYLCTSQHLQPYCLQPVHL